MNRKLRLLAIIIVYFCWTIQNAAAQFVTIPNAILAGFFASNFPSCMQGNKLDTTCFDILSLTSLDISLGGIDDITGIQYFKSLEVLSCTNNKLTFLPRLPSDLKTLYCDNNKLESLPAIPKFLIHLDCDLNNLSKLPLLPVTLEFLSCEGNQLTDLPDLPNSLSYLRCSFNKLNSLPPLPGSLGDLFCNVNQLKKLPSLPSKLGALECTDNQLSDLPLLPEKLDLLYCESNQLSSLPPLPKSLLGFSCYNNKIKCLPLLPSNILYLDVSGNLLKCIPNHIAVMDSSTASLPLCVDGDTINNPNGCSNKIAGVKKVEFGKGVLIYPNPGSGIYNFLISEEMIVQFSDIEVYDLSGLLLFKIKPVEGLNEINLSNYATGLYNLRMTGSGISINKILVKR